MKHLGCASVLLACAALQSASAAEWKMEPAGSRLEFAATFEKSPAPGVFKEFDTRLSFDPEKPAGGRLDVTIRVTSADMSSADINKAIAGVEWFDFARYQQAEFHSTDIQRGNASSGSYVARGVLTLKGIQQPVEVPFKWTEAAEGATMQGEFVVKRTPFAIGTGEWSATDVIGPQVTVKFTVQLRKVR